MPRAPGANDGSPPEFGTPPRGQGSGSFYPLNVDRVVKLTFSLYRFRWRVFLGIALIVLIPTSAASGLLQGFTGEAIAQWTREVLLAVQRGDTTASDFLALMPWPALSVTWLVSLVISLITYLALAATTHATAVAFSGGTPTISQSLREAVRRFRSLTVVYLVSFFVTLAIVLVGVAVAGLLFLANVSNGAVQPGLFVFLALIVIVALFALVIFIAVRWSFALTAVMVEKVSGVTALRRSWALATGSSWRILGYLFLFGFLAGLPVAVLGYVATALLGSGITQTASGLIVSDPVQGFMSTFAIGIIAALFSPFPTIGLTLLYFDVRSRRGESVPQPGSPPPLG